MNRLKVKICGLRRPEDVSFVNEAGPDFAGFIFDPTRRRYIEPEKAAALRAQLADSIQAVGVFVNAEPSLIADIASQVKLDRIQLHGSEDNDYIRRLRQLTDLPLIQAFKILTAEDVQRSMESEADLVLLDNGKGGTGTAFDWSLIENVTRDFILAGGISPDNAKEAVETCRPWGIDASSSLETDGCKDREKILKLMNEVNAIRLSSFESQE